MLTVTDAATTYLKDVLHKAGAAEGKTARLAFGKSGAELVLDEEKPSDTKVSQGGETVLVYDKKLAERFENKTLDAQVSEDGARLVFREA